MTLMTTWITRRDKGELLEMRNALLGIIVSGRRQRLQERETTRPTAKAPPPEVRASMPIQEKINRMTLQELRDQVRREDERMAKHKGGFYVSPPIPLLQLYRDRIDILETQLQEEADRMERLREQEKIVLQQEAEHRAAVQEVRRVAAELAEKAHQEELDRQAAMTAIPEEQVAQEPEQAEVQPPLIGENTEAQT
eukprot:296321-Amphidinium_carterae.1